MLWHPCKCSERVSSTRSSSEPDLRSTLIGSPPSIAEMLGLVCLKRLILHVSCPYTLTAMLLYDWVLCLDQEVACIWKARGGLNAGSLVYALSRFSLIFGMVSNTATIFPMSPLVSSRVHCQSRIPVVYPPTEVNTTTRGVVPLPQVTILKLIIPHSCSFAIRTQSFFILLSRLSICSACSYTHGPEVRSQKLIVHSPVFSAFRVYAVSGRKILPTIVVSLLSAIQIIISLVRDSA